MNRQRNNAKSNQQGAKNPMTVKTVTQHLAKETKKAEKLTLKQKEEAAMDTKFKEFTKYYQGINLVPQEEWRAFMKENIGKAYLAFRFITRHWRCHSHLDTVPGIPSQTDVIMDYMRTKFQDSVSKLVVDNTTQLELKALPWYPNDLAWTININHGDMAKYLGLKDFFCFLTSEKSQFTIQQIEVWSMLPPRMLRIQPHHKVLDMCASPGFMAGQISEIMHSDPNILNEGLLVFNDWWKVTDKMQYKWCQGPKAIFTNHDARHFPEIFTSDSKEPIRYDRVICDVKCSNDGTMRKHTSLQETWTSTTALQYHKDQLAVLRRGLELVTQGGMVLYSTTALHPVENEAVIMGMLKECSGTVDLVDIRRIIPDFKFRQGMSTWKVMSGEGYFFSSYAETTEEFQKKYPESVFPPPLREAIAFHMERCARVLPHDNSTAGFFCALLVKTRELPWIKAKKEAEAAVAKVEEKKKEAPPPSNPDGKKKYGYTLGLQPQTVLLEIEWTVENTNRFLQTRTKIEKQLFPIPPHEVDPNCQPKKLLLEPDALETYGYCTPTDEDWLKIKEFFKISDNFDARTLIVRQEKTQWFLSSLLVRDVITHNKKRLDIDLHAESGVPVFNVVTDLCIPCDTTCQFMFTEEGFAALYPYIGKQIVKVTKDDILTLAYNQKVKINQLSEKAQADVKETDQGCILFVYRPLDFNAVPRCNLTFVGARGENYIIDYKAGDTTERKNTFRLCGLEREDYRRKIQEEKLAKVVEIERQKKAALKEAMDTS